MFIKNIIFFPTTTILLLLKNNQLYLFLYIVCLYCTLKILIYTNSIYVNFIDIYAIAAFDYLLKKYTLYQSNYSSNILFFIALIIVLTLLNNHSLITIYIILVILFFCKKQIKYYTLHNKFYDLNYILELLNILVIITLVKHLY